LDCVVTASFSENGNEADNGNAGKNIRNVGCQSERNESHNESQP
jgi:hypothetical protein